MSKKIWIIVSSIILCGILLIGMTGCGNKKTEEKNTQDEARVSTIIEDFAKYMNNKEIEKAVNLINMEEYAKIVDYIDREQLELVLLEMNVEAYEISNIKKATEEEEKTVAEEYGSYENFKEVYKDYQKYAVDYKLSINGNTIENKDIFFIKEDNGGYSLVISKMWQGYIDHSYIMNNENVNSEE